MKNYEIRGRKTIEISERVRLEDAAIELGCSEQCVREHMKRGIWDLGSVVVTNGKKGKKRYSYHIYRRKLDRHLGKEA